MEINPQILESHIIPDCEHKNHNIPNKALEIYKEESEQGLPTAIAFYNNDYYVIQSSGQGPYIIWRKEDMYDEERSFVMIRKELENTILDYLNNNFEAGAYIGKRYLRSLIPKFEDNEIIIEMNNKDGIELGTLGFISNISNTSDITFHVEIRYADCDRYGIITIKNFIL